MTKRLFALIFAVITIMAVTGCKNKNDEEKDIESGTEIISGSENISAVNTKSKKFILESLNAAEHPVRLVCMIMPLSGNMQEATKTEMGISGGNYYVDMTTEENGHVTIMIKDDYVYTISHDSKTAIKTVKTDDTDDINPFIFIMDRENINLNSSNMSAGQDELNGKPYDYEEFISDSKAIRFLFEGDVCKAIKSTEDGVTETLLIEEYDENVDNSKFEVPEGYKLTEI